MITDTQLSAFLDAELPESEMQMIRDAMVEDEGLAIRLAELASVDAAIQQAVSEIDQRPLPQGICELLEEANDTKAQTASKASADVVDFSRWRAARQKLSQYTGEIMAVAAMTTLVLGVSMFQQNGIGEDQALQIALSQQPSGKAIQIDDKTFLTPQVSFKSQQGEFCRQYQLKNEETTRLALACFQNDHWQTLASINKKSIDSSAEYQTASANPVLDKEIDRLIEGGFLNRAEEQQMLEALSKEQH